MKSDYSVTQISTGPACVHRYYDIPCISPDEAKLMYFRFSDAIPGPGDVIVADADGANAEMVGHASGSNIGHTGADATWIDKHTITFKPQGCDVRLHTIQSLVDGSSREVRGNIRQVHQPTRQALVLSSADDAAVNEFDRQRRTNISRLDLDSFETVPLFTVKEAAETHPAELDLVRMNFMNAKWSPAGDMFFVVFTDEIYRRYHGGDRKTKCLILANADGSDIRYLGEFGHHPLWTPDGSGIIAHNLKPEGGQDLVRFDLHGGEPQILIEDFVGIHSTLNRAQSHVITDGFNFPEQGQASVLRYELATGKRETLCTGSQKNYDHRNSCHVHPRFSMDERSIHFNMEDTGTPQVYCLELG